MSFVACDATTFQLLLLCCDCCCSCSCCNTLGVANGKMSPQCSCLFFLIVWQLLS